MSALNSDNARGECSPGGAKELRFRAVVVDIRGTLTESRTDRPMCATLAADFARLLESGCWVAVVTGARAASAMRRVVEPILQVRNGLLSGGRLFLYSESGSECHELVDQGLRAVADYGFQELVPHQVGLVTELLGNECSTANMGPFMVVRTSSQWRVYFDRASFDRRAAIASALREQLTNRGIPVAVHVPACRAAIDVSLGSKYEAVRHFIRMLHIPTSRVLIIADTLRSGGADVSMLQATRGKATAIHVGRGAAVAGAVRSPIRGWRGTHFALTHVLETQHDVRRR